MVSDGFATAARGTSVAQGEHSTAERAALETDGRLSRGSDERPRKSSWKVCTDIISPQFVQRRSTWRFRRRLDWPIDFRWLNRLGRMFGRRDLLDQLTGLNCRETTYNFWKQRLHVLSIALYSCCVILEVLIVE